MPGNIELKAVSPQEAIKYFRDKGYRFSFDWRDTWHEQHAYAFTVAKAMRLDILQDIRTEVDRAIAEGTTLADFKKRLKPTLQEKGWWGRKIMIDPQTGEEREVQLGSSRRLRTIYDTNLRTSYSAGRWERIERVKKSRPYLRYVAVLDSRTRPQHRAWHDTVLPVDDPFWEKFYPPNGWHCRCTVQQLSERDLQRRGLKVSNRAPTPPDRAYINKRNGTLERVPQGIDPGFGFNPGKAKMKALVPPALDKPLDVPYVGKPTSVAMPVMRRVGQSALFPAGLSESEYVRRFMASFDTTPDKPIIFTDVAGDNLVISDDLFKTASGRLKLGKDTRGQYLGLLAQTIKEPDEIWHVWEEYPKGRMTLRRKYIAQYEVEGEKTPAFVLFDTSSQGWLGVTAFPPEKDGYIFRQRNGVLVWRRADLK